MRITLLTAAFITLLTPCFILAADLRQLASDAVSTDSKIAANAIKSLRERGPAGLDALHETHGDTIASYRRGRSVDASVWNPLKSALDQVARQHDAWASSLYWYTDLEQAKQAAAEQGKPILTLRLLGNLDEELSCANSRFFRTVLYPDRDVADYLHDHYILHWQSVRPAPRVTVDFGDGRRIERTITGNSIHYVIAADGTIIDAIPGLYSPKRFLDILVRCDSSHRVVNASRKIRSQDEVVTHLHARVASDLEDEWRENLIQLGYSRNLSPAPEPVKNPKALQAAARITAKTAVEFRVVRQLAAMPTSIRDLALLDNGVWSDVARLHDVMLDDFALMMIARKHASPDTLAPLIEQFRRSIAEDTVRNEFMFRREMHRWLAENPRVELAQFNERVYADLFLTPSSDPWLGLAPADAYSAILNEGLIEPASPGLARK